MLPNKGYGLAVAEWVGCKSRADALCHSKAGLKVHWIVHWHIPINNICFLRAFPEESVGI
jgi:hypothetical protein